MSLYDTVYLFYEDHILYVIFRYEYIYYIGVGVEPCRRNQSIIQVIKDRIMKNILSEQWYKSISVMMMAWQA